jgi:hypothetical protein
LRGRSKRGGLYLLAGWGLNRRQRRRFGCWLGSGLAKGSQFQDHRLRTGVVKRHNFEVCRVSTSNRTIKKIEHDVAERLHLFVGLEVTGGELQVFEEFMPLERRRRRGRMWSIHTRWSVCSLVTRLTSGVFSPVEWEVGRCLRWKRSFLRYRCLRRRHRYIR